MIEAPSVGSRETEARTDAHPLPHGSDYEPVAALRLVPIYFGTRANLLAPLADRLSDVFELPVDQQAFRFDPELALDDARGQYNSRILLGQLDQSVGTAKIKILGITSVDLFIPVLTYVFGEAQLDSRAAVVSTYRLENELYGLAPDTDRLFERLCKEAIHELGHTFNLVHCHHDRCVMQSSTYVEDIDLKSDRFCSACLTMLKPAPDQTRRDPRRWGWFRRPK
jgi:archaemetzincin